MGLAYPAREALVRPLVELASAASRAGSRGFASVWLLGGSAEESASLPVLAAALGTAVPDLRVGVRLTAYDDPVRMAEDLCVLDNALWGRLDVALVHGERPGGSEWGGLSRVRAVRDLAGGRPVELGAGVRPRPVRVSPPPRQHPLPVAVWVAGTSPGPALGRTRSNAGCPMKTTSAPARR